MGRAITTKRIEITQEIKDLQKLAIDARAIGCEARINIEKDEVLINGIHKKTRSQAKEFLTDLITRNKTAKGVLSYPDQEELAKEEKLKKKLARKNKEPGAPPEFKALIRRAKRIYKKTLAKTGISSDAKNKAFSYLDRKAATPDDNQKAMVALSEYISKGEI